MWGGSRKFHGTSCGRPSGTRLVLRSSNTKLSIRSDDEAANPIEDLFRSKQRLDAVEERGPSGDSQADQQHAAMASRRIAAEIGEIEILGNQEAICVLCFT